MDVVASSASPKPDRDVMMLLMATSTSAAPAISAQDLTKRYGSTLALDALELSIPPGEVYGFLGPNGAGKTTTIRLLLGLQRPPAGSASCSWAGFTARSTRSTDRR